MFRSFRTTATACVVGLAATLASSAPAMARHGGDHGRGYDRGGPRASVQVGPSNHRVQVRDFRNASRVIQAPLAYYGPRHGYGARLFHPAPFILGPRVIYSSPIYSSPIYSAPIYVPPIYAPPIYVSPVQYVQRIETPPVVYIERSDPQPVVEPAPGAYWYFCQDSGSYYPYVGECASPWQPVPAQPPATRR